MKANNTYTRWFVALAIAVVALGCQHKSAMVVAQPGAGRPAAMARTETIFEYCLPLSMFDENARHGMMAIMANAAARGEPMISFFGPASLAEQVRELGFAEVWDFGPQEANARYLSGRNDRLLLPSSFGFHLMGARVS